VNVKTLDVGPLGFLTWAVQLAAVVVTLAEIWISLEFTNVVRLAGIGYDTPKLVSVTVAPDTNAVPLIVMVWSPFNGGTGFGEIPVMVGATPVVKYTPTEGELEPAELEAATSQM
jgi:hypothetical protein